jgi:ABC-type branched-subunit amino acid transport system ATPase component
MNAIIANHLFKSFEKGKIKALEDISFEVKQSELFGLIGPDGAGKPHFLGYLRPFYWPNLARQASIRSM